MLVWYRRLTRGWGMCAEEPGPLLPGLHRDLTEAGSGATRGLSVHGPEAAGVGERLCVLSCLGIAVTPQFAVAP